MFNIWNPGGGAATPFLSVAEVSGLCAVVFQDIEFFDTTPAESGSGLRRSFSTIADGSSSPKASSFCLFIVVCQFFGVLPFVLSLLHYMRVVL